MPIICTLLIFIGLYFFIVFVVLRFITPFMGFGSFRSPKQVPQEIKDKINELEDKSSTPDQYLKLAYNFIISRWHAGRLSTVRYAPLAFRRDLSAIWKQPGYAHCNTQNYMLFVLLTGSKFFKPADIKPKHIFFNFFIHQYLQVKVSNGWMAIDPAGASIHGLPFGSHIRLFG